MLHVNGRYRQAYQFTHWSGRAGQVFAARRICIARYMLRPGVCLLVDIVSQLNGSSSLSAQQLLSVGKSGFSKNKGTLPNPELGHFSAFFVTASRPLRVLSTRFDRATFINASDPPSFTTRRLRRQASRCSSVTSAAYSGFHFWGYKFN